MFGIAGAVPSLNALAPRPAAQVPIEIFFVAGCPELSVPLRSRSPVGVLFGRSVGVPREVGVLCGGRGAVR